MTFADVIRDARRARGLSQLELAFAARTSQSRISAIESGATCELETALRIAAALGLEVRIGSHTVGGIESLPLSA